MLNTIEAISNLLKGTFLEGSAIRQLEIDESDECAIEIKVPRTSALDAWHLMRAKLKGTQQYPIVTEGWGSDDYFSRFYYREEEEAGKLRGVSPRAIIAEASTVNLDDFLSVQRIASKEFLEDSIEFSLEETREHFGRCPNDLEVRELIHKNIIHSTVDLEKWLFEWELKHFDRDDVLATPDTRYLDWYEPNTQLVTLIVLPIENGWDALAYIHWFGACSAGTSVAIGFLKKWFQQYGAELVCHYGTMLQLEVESLPETPEESFELAWQQEALAECTTILPGVSLRHHARSLLSVNRWFLHERP
jgi:Domain of unknown function (DUF4253)